MVIQIFPLNTFIHGLRYSLVNMRKQLRLEQQNLTRKKYNEWVTGSSFKLSEVMLLCHHQTQETIELP